ASAAAASAASAASYCTASTASCCTASAASCCAASAASCCAASATSMGNFIDELRCFGVFLVEDIERREADVRNFLLIERNFGKRCVVLGRYVRYRHSCRCTASQCKRCTGRRQSRSGYPPTHSLRSLLRARHSRASYLRVNPG